MVACPKSDVLRKLESGLLSDDEAEAIFPHLCECSQCAEALESYRAQNLDGRVIRNAINRGPSSTTAPSPSKGAASPPGGGSFVWDIPDYERVRLCGEGAFGSVWAVRNRVGIYRALKTINLGQLKAADVACRESTALETYCRHIQRHPNLIEVFHVGVQGDILYYTMELADDDASRRPVRDQFPSTYCPLTLYGLMTTTPVSANTSIEIVLQLLRGLSRLHAVDLAHRDIKPANIVFVNKRPKLADIGMITTATATPSQVGTPEYMPPDLRMDLTADTYAMGVILKQLLSGTKLGSATDGIARALEISDQWNLRGIHRVVDQACSPEGNARYQQADHMLDAIESCREMDYDTLFAELKHDPCPPITTGRTVYVPIVVALIHVLPWTLALLLAIMLTMKLI